MSVLREQEILRYRTWLTLFVSTLLGLVFAFTTVLAGSKPQHADSLYQTELARVGSVSLEESLEAFRHVLKADRNHAPAHYEVAKLYMSMDTPVGRQSARKSLDEAIRLEPGNGDYQLMLGELLGKQGLWLKAERHYEKVCETHPERLAEAAYRVGFFSMQAFLKYINLEHVDIVTGGGAHQRITCFVGKNTLRGIGRRRWHSW